MGHVLSFIHMRSLSGCSVFGKSLELSICVLSMCVCVCVCVCVRMLSPALYKDFYTFVLVQRSLRGNLVNRR